MNVSEKFPTVNSTYLYGFVLPSWFISGITAGNGTAFAVSVLTVSLTEPHKP
jgi:hypothetical protein